MIYVDAPARATAPCPCVFLMDGDYFFDAAVEACASLRAEKLIPPVVLVAVGYGAGFNQPGNYRGRDYTPTASDLEPTSGGAKPFLAFLTDTLWPEVAKRFPVDPHYRVIAGHSLGSLLALYALFQPKPFFHGVLASAPSIWWDDRSVMKQAKALRDRHASLPANLFLGVGAEDTPSMTGDLGLLQAQLAARPFTSLNVTSEIFALRDHLTVLPDSLRAGFRSLLSGAADQTRTARGR